MLAASCRNEIFRSAVGTFDPLHSGRGSRLVITTTSDSVRLTFRISSFIVTIVSGCLSLHLSLLLARLIGFCCRFQFFDHGRTGLFGVGVLLSGTLSSGLFCPFGEPVFLSYIRKNKEYHNDNGYFHTISSWLSEHKNPYFDLL